MRRHSAMRVSGLVVLAATTATGLWTRRRAGDRRPAAVVDGLEQRGETLFTEETFDGNDRVCSTCHEPEKFGTITPEVSRAS